jgi:HK97 family phage major capsid protein
LEVSLISDPKARTWDEVASFHRAAAELADARGTNSNFGANVPIYASGGDSPGEVFVRSKAFERVRAMVPDGTSTVRPFTTEPVQLGSMRALLITTGAPISRPTYQGILEPGTVRPLFLRDLVTVKPVRDTNTVEYSAETGRGLSAAPVAESTALTGSSGTKPEGSLTFVVNTAPIRTIALYLPVTTKVLADSAELRAYIDDYLREALALALEDQMLTGNGSGQNFTGILSTAGIGNATAQGGEQGFDVLRRARRLVQVNGRTEPNGVVAHPNDAEKLDIMKTAEGVYYSGGPVTNAMGFPAIWGMPVIISDALTAGTALVGDFRRAVLFDREQTTISVGTINDQFIRNQVSILGEVRCAFAVLRPAAFSTATIP